MHTYMPWCVCVSQRTVCGNLFHIRPGNGLAPSAFINLTSPGFVFILSASYVLMGPTEDLQKDAGDSKARDAFQLVTKLSTLEADYLPETQYNPPPSV